MSKPIKPPRRSGGGGSSSLSRPAPPSSDVDPNKGSKSTTTSKSHNTNNNTKSRHHHHRHGGKRPPRSPRKKSSFANIIQNKKFDWSSAAAPSQPSRKVSIEDLINETLAPSLSSSDDRNSDLRPIQEKPKAGSIVVKRRRRRKKKKDDGKSTTSDNNNNQSSSDINDDFRGDDRPSIQDIYICDNEGTFTSLRDLMDGRSFMMNSHESPFANIQEEYGDGEEGSDSYAAESEEGSSSEQHDLSLPPGPPKKISFQDIMNDRDYALLAPPTAVKKESYQDIAKRQRFQLLETLIDTAMKGQFDGIDIDDEQSIDEIFNNTLTLTSNKAKTQYLRIESKTNNNNTDKSNNKSSRSQRTVQPLNATMPGAAAGSATASSAATATPPPQSDRSTHSRFGGIFLGGKR